MPQVFAAEFRQAADSSVDSVNVCRGNNDVAKSLDVTVPRGQQTNLFVSVQATLHGRFIRSFAADFDLSWPAYPIEERAATPVCLLRQRGAGSRTSMSFHAIDMMEDAFIVLKETKKGGRLNVNRPTGLPPITGFTGAAHCR
ncbi:MAG: hypothetical protein KDB01_17150 [Planctomycetaceae bacterium]|nr:hypothetical protein [Planctomycetaceae bacterium]